MLSLTRRRHRTGYTTIEMIMVVVVTGILFAITLPRFSTVKYGSTLRAGRQQLASVMASARAAALLKGKSAVLVTGSNVATVWAQTGLAGNWVRVAGPVRFDDSGLTLTPLGNAPASLVYDARGLLSPVPSEILKYELAMPGYADTLCLSRSGVIMQKGCTL
jgi:Tfp pilus assembly protein FimT